MPNKFYKSYFIAHLEFYIDVLCVLKLPNIVCEEIVKMQLVYKGEGLSTFKQGFVWDQGIQLTGEKNHLHRFLDSTFAASFVIYYTL